MAEPIQAVGSAIDQPDRGAAAAAPRYGIGLTLLLASLVSMGPFSIDMYLPSLPTLAEHFAVGPREVQLTLSTFFFGFAGGQLIYGPLSDRIGRRRPLLFGLMLFIVASLLCSMATSMEQLIGLRLVQALGACSGVVLARAAVRDLFGREQSAQMMSYMMLAVMLAPMLAPIVGGQVLVFAGWRAIFAILAAIGLVLLIVAWVGMKETLPPARRQRLSPSQMAWSYVSLLRDRNYIGYVLSSSSVFAGMFAYISGSPFVFIELYGVAPEHFGFLFGSNIVGLMVGALCNGRLIPRFGSDRILRFGIAVAAIAGVSLAIVTATGIGGLPMLMVPLFFYIGSISLIAPNATAGALSARPDIAGAGAALSGAMQFTAGALSGTLLGLLNDGTALPMGVTIGVAGVMGFTFHRWLVLGRRENKIGT